MSDEVEEQEDGEIITWTKVKQLDGSKFGSLARDLMDLIEEAEDLKGRIEAARKLCEPHVQKVKDTSFEAAGLIFRWHGEGKPTWKLSEKKMVQDGVTPDQMKKWKEQQKGKKAHMVVRLPKEQKTTEE